MLIRRMPFARSLQVLTIEHGHLADEATVRLISQGRVAEYLAWGAKRLEKPAPGQEEKGKPLIGAWERLLCWAKQYNAAFEPTFVRPQRYLQAEHHVDLAGTDLQQLRDVEDRNLETAELFAMSGSATRIKKQLCASGRSVGGYVASQRQSLQDINLLKDYEHNFVVIKDGKVYKNTL